MTTSPSNFRRTVLIAKKVITTAILVAAPTMLMAQPAPFEVTEESIGYAPEWTADMSKRFPACEAHKEGALTPAVVVIRQSGDVQRISTDAAYAINTDDNRANDLWVVGTCEK